MLPRVRRHPHGVHWLDIVSGFAAVLVIRGAHNAPARSKPLASLASSQVSALPEGGNGSVIRCSTRWPEVLTRGVCWQTNLAAGDVLAGAGFLHIVSPSEKC